MRPTWAPEGDALLLVGLADAVVAVALHIVAGVTVMQVHIGRTVGTDTGAELRQVTRVTGLSTGCTCWLQLHRDREREREREREK